MRSKRRFRLGIVTNEYFDPALGRVGGFGWAASAVAELFRGAPELGVDVVMFGGEQPQGSDEDELEIRGTRLVVRSGSALRDVQRTRAWRPDVFLTIDYRPSYTSFVDACPRTPLILWARDPRSRQDGEKFLTLRIPGLESETPAGLGVVRTIAAFPRMARRSRWLHRRLLFATTAACLATKVEDAYGVKPSEVTLLPNPIRLPELNRSRTERPIVVYLGRLDPHKRPWIVIDVARRCPEVDFLFLGGSFATDGATWEPEALPPNVKLCGHVGPTQKTRTLQSAAVAINTSIHEGLAVSMLEALACGTPLLSCQDPEGVVSRFGAHVGRFDGTGVESVPRFVEALEDLLDDGCRRERLGRAGRQWVADHHNPARFLEAFRYLCLRAGRPVSADDEAPFTVEVGAVSRTSGPFLT